MDIRQLKYFVEIVQSDCNMSKAAKHLFVSQSALSQIISTFEEANNLSLFYRERGRLVGLTPIGHKYYKYALEMIGLYDRMMTTIHNESRKLNNVVRIGLPSIVLRTKLTNIVLDLPKDLPDLKLEIIEGGCQFLYERLEEGDIDLAILMDPIRRNGDFQDQVIIQDQFVVFMDPANPLTKKKKVTWDDVNKVPIAIFNDSFSTNHLVMDQFAQRQMKPEIFIHSSSWEYLVDLVKGNEIVTILPLSTYPLINSDQIVYREFKKNLPFDIYLSRKNYEVYPSSHNLLFDWLKKYVSQQVQIQ
ncbi:LysR family transcriptional regulator [Facklamia miroungae]|uniref:DNA-binding transcriptional regulator, LysR family n=1 Tax=Facklamia miroungae TaxID=120956 RepID=A0A1G7T9Z9_9LACT|nr:LysR family transcriptional regulator [Facklamia miroungae]NKZ29731.1 LysR family transcriptional regulator [Facklamia miroungae]SDG32118.1 DNA-binding transcriptional regulator, LysR family [Facklamia miroungae]